MTAVSPSEELEEKPSGSEILSRASTVLTPALDAAVDRLSPELRIPVQHHMAGGGKRVRGALVLLSATATGGWEETALAGAVAIELVHNYSLLHDDVIDEDRNRRHRPTVWAQFGVGQAIVAGDALAALAVEILLETPTPERVRAAIALVSSNQAMITGQANDMAFESRASVTVEECIRMADGKTGALLACASSLGAILAGAPGATVESLADFGRHVGIAFQAVDDLLGIWGDPSQTGKPAGNDLVRQKKTLPVAAAMANSGSRRAELEERLGQVRTAADVADAARLIEECGGRSAVSEIAASHLDRALKRLDQADLVGGGREQLELIARFVTARDR